MFGSMITNRLGTMISPARTEIRLAQEQALERINKVLRKAEKEVSHKGRFMSTEQRFSAAESELENAEQHLLSALSSMFKAINYMAPNINLFNTIMPIKEITGITIDQEPPRKIKAARKLFNRKN